MPRSAVTGIRAAARLGQRLEPVVSGGGSSGPRSPEWSGHGARVPSSHPPITSAPASGLR